MVLGEAVKVTAMGETVTVAFAVTVPPGPVAVALKVVVWLIAPVLMLPAEGETEPIPLLIVSDVVFAVDHVNFDVPPAATVIGEAEN